MSNFPLAYKLSWLPRLLKPSLKGDRHGYMPAEGTLLSPKPGRTKKLVFLGDISAVANKSAPEIDAGLRALIASADLVVANCESPVVDKPRRPFGTTIGTRHAMTARFLSETLHAAGVQPRRLILSLANNHMLDQGVEGYAETRAALAALGIPTIGGAEDGPVRIVELDGPTIAFAAFAQWWNVSRDDFDGRVMMLDDFARHDFAALRESRADLVCVLPHWDREFRHFPQHETRQLAGKLAGTGAGLIVGGHAHVLQPAERIGETLVAYGLGDLLSTALPNQPWPTRIGAVLVVEISADPSTRGRIAGYRFAPFFRKRIGERERLVPATDERVRRRFAAIFPD